MKTQPRGMSNGSTGLAGRIGTPLPSSTMPRTGESLATSWPASASRLPHRPPHPELKTSALPPTGGADPLDAIDQRIRLDEISDALSQLTEDQRNVVLNRLVLGLDLEETSKVMGKNVGSIKALQHRALAHLAKILTPGVDDHA